MDDRSESVAPTAPPRAVVWLVAAGLAAVIASPGTAWPQTFSGGAAASRPPASAPAYRGPSTLLAPPDRSVLWLALRDDSSGVPYSVAPPVMQQALYPPPAQAFYPSRSIDPVEPPLIRTSRLQEAIEGVETPAERQEAAAKEGETTYGVKAVDNTLQFLRRQSVLLNQGEWQFDTGLVYSLFEYNIPATFVNGGGAVVGVAREDIRRRLLYSPFAIRYGMTPNVQFFAFMPVGGSNTQMSVVGESASTSLGGQGDLTTGLNVRLRSGCGYYPEVIGTFAVTAPTGVFNGDPLFGVVPLSGLGQGFWAIAGQLLMINVYDPIIVFYGGGYRHLFGRDFTGVLYQPGEQINYQLGVGFAVNDRVTLSTAFQGFYITDTLLDRTIIPGTNIEPMTVRLAVTVTRPKWIIEPFALLGMTEFAPRASVGVVLTRY